MERVGKEHTEAYSFTSVRSIKSLVKLFANMVISFRGLQNDHLFHNSCGFRAQTALGFPRVFIQSNSAPCSICK
jgi:hypothetical protein